MQNKLCVNTTDYEIQCNQGCVKGLINNIEVTDKLIKCYCKYFISEKKIKSKEGVKIVLESETKIIK